MSAVTHYRLERLVEWRGVVVAETALHIGCGKSHSPGTSDSPILRDPSGAPYVPGSSLRGVLRSGVESLLRSIDDHASGLWACDLFDAPCVEGMVQETTGGQQRAAVVEAHACAACRVFGLSGFASRVWIGDLRCTSVAEAAVRDGVGIDRDLRTARNKIKFDYEYLAPGTELGLELRARNLDDWELGLVALGLTLLDDGTLRLGGLGARGLGRVRTRLQRLSVADAASMLAGRPATPTPIATDCSEALSPYLTALRARLDQKEA